MSSIFRVSIISHVAAIAAGAFAATAYLSVNSGRPQSLADYISAICTKGFGSAPAAEAPYLAENVSAMTKMMIDMGIRPSGDVDTDFVALMVPHHQGAIEMAQAELRYGRNEPLRRMAQEIIVTQLQEITAMRLSLGQSLPPSAPSPGMTIFSPDGKYGYVCSSFTPETEVIAVADHKIVGRVPQASPFCPNIAATPDSKQIWFTLKDTGKTQVFDAQPPFALLKTLDTGPITNHVNIVRNANGMFAYVTIGGLNEIKVFRTDNFEQVATIPVGKLPHGIWPSGDGTRVYVGLENEDKVAAIDTLKNEIIATSPIGQAPQALVYVPDAVPAVSGAPNSAMTRMMVDPEGLGTNNLQPLGVAGQSTELWLAPPGAKKEAKAPTSVSLSDQGLVQVLEAAVTGLEPGKPYLLALASEPSGAGVLEPLQGFMTNPAGAAVVNAIGPIRQVVRGEDKIPQRYLVILAGTPDNHGAAVQVQRE